jgi:hypothetical protein
VLSKASSRGARLRALLGVSLIRVLIPMRLHARSELTRRLRSHPHYRGVHPALPKVTIGEGRHATRPECTGKDLGTRNRRGLPPREAQSGQESDSLDSMMPYGDGLLGEENLVNLL